MILPQRRKRESFLPWVQLALDCVLIQILLRFSFWLRFVSPYFEDRITPVDHPFYLRVLNLIMIVIIFFLRSYDLYKPLRLLTPSAETIKIFKAVASGMVILTAITFFIRDFSYSRTFFALAGVVLALGLSVGRYLFWLVVMWVDRRRGSQRNIVIAGCDENARRLAAYYKKNPRFGTCVVGFFDDNIPRGTELDGVPVLGKIDEIARHLKFNRQVHEVVLAAPGFSSEQVLKLIYECEKEMVTFRWIADIFGLIASKMSVSHLGGVSILSFKDSPLLDWENRILKRSMDIVGSAFALICLSPLFLVVSILIKRDSPGPIFYRQQRVGEDGRRFMLLKFRTMREDAEQQTGPVWAVEGDPRRTRLGAFMRKNNLDEFPQLWNVLTGDMSLVGPRPERPFFVSQFKEDIPRYMARHSIRSGITGWAQVNGLRGNTSIEERTKYDLFYIENWSLLFDVKILFMTLFARNNAY